MDVRVGHEESWASKKMLLNCGVKTLESPLECKEIKPVSPKGNQPWILIGRIAAEVLILWPPDAKNWLFSWKDPDSGKNWRQEEKGTTEDEMVEWHHRFNGHWVWASSASWWWTGRPGVLQFMELQRVGHNWATDWTELKILVYDLIYQDANKMSENNHT